LREALGSALRQEEGPQYEVIVVDNAASEETLKIARGFESARVSVYYNDKNLGMWGSIEVGVSAATGDWVLILCDDDLLLPGALRQFEAAISRNQKDRIGCLAGGTALLLADDVQPILRPPTVQLPFRPPWRRMDPFPVPPGAEFEAVPKLCSSIFRRDEVLAVGSWDRECVGYADLALFLELQKRGLLYGSMEVFGSFRIHGGNDSNPLKIWDTYPINAAERLLVLYGEGCGAGGVKLRRQIESSYVKGLWKIPLSSNFRRQYAREVLERLARTKRYRLLLRCPWLMGVLGALFRFARPRAGRIVQAFRRVAGDRG
jgi:glycosyltransferase involved in cell wall biosynthesis